ncbi:ABC transporter substrate-binding protein [Bacilliculturomica massiliensis]|uniref:ABC transporter substrate-binding protein n=1 Tax=Bacilliculturomica massiliensis TaxID=1917867 RepID=UPI00103041C9|nr:ABC transporter substrate-binding protein [Bacilliculturomica massiliensis]
MKKLRKSLLFILTGLLSLTLIVGCGDSETSGPDSGEATTGLPLSGQHFIIAVNAENAPMESVDPSGEYIGFSVDLAAALADRLGFTYEWSDMEFFGLIGSIQEGRADMILSSISATDERREMVDFSDGYFQPITCIISAKDSGISTIEDLNGRKVGGATGTLFEKYAQTIPGVNYVSFDSTVPAIEIIGTSQLDAIIESSSYGERYAAGKDLDVHVIPKSVIREYAPFYAIAFPKGSDENVKLFNEALAELETDGTLQELRSEWLGQDYVDKLAIFNEE